MAQLRYLLGRLVQMSVTLAAVVTFTFFLFRAVPGGPEAAVIGPNLDPSTADSLRARFGVDKPVGEQFLDYISRLAHGDFGTSFQYHTPVSGLLLDDLFNTLALVIPAVVVAWVLGMVAGAWVGASPRRQTLDGAATNIAYLAKAAPIFWVATMAVFVFSHQFDLVSAVGMRTTGDLSSGFGAIMSVDFVYHLVLPASVLILVFLPEPLLTMRTAMRESVVEDYVDMERALGLTPRRITYRHVARNALLPVVSLVPALMSAIIGGQVIIETIFSWPGLGRAIVEATRSFDYPMMQGVFLITAIIAVVSSAAIDILYAYLDPRVALV